jgi:multiple sugar transport system permease protein
VTPRNGCQGRASVPSVLEGLLRPDPARAGGVGADRRLLGAFGRITLPLAAPGLAALAVIAFVDAWNGFTFPLILTSRQALKPFTVAVYGFVGEYGEVQWHLVSAVSVASVLPLLVLFVVFQRSLVSGLTGGAIKS